MRSVKPLLLKFMPLWRDVIWLIYDKLTKCDKYALLRAQTGGDIDDRMVALYARDGYMFVKELLIAFDRATQKLCLNAACKSGNIEIVRAIIAMGLIPKHKDAFAAARHGHASILKLAYDVANVTTNFRTNIHINKYMIRDIVIGGSLECVKWVYENTLEDVQYVVKYLAKYAAYHNRIEVARWTVNNTPYLEIDERPRTAISIAAFCGRLEIVKLLYTREDVNVFRSACMGGCLRTIEWLLTQKCDTFFGQCDIPTYLRNWLLERGIVQSREISHEVAAAMNNVDHSEWLRMRGDKPFPYIWTIAMIHESMQYLEWMNNHVRRHGEDCDDLLEIGIAHDNMQSVIWLINAMIDANDDEDLSIRVFALACTRPRETALIWFNAFAYETSLEIYDGVYHACKEAGACDELLQWIDNEIKNQWVSDDDSM
jgi:hypothetical protein